MIYYFTALIISYSIGDQEALATVWYKNEQHCIEAMNSQFADPLYNHLYELYGTDIMMSCEVSNVVSYKLVPKMRPENG